MLAMARKRREAERNKKMEETFNKADVNNIGRLTVDQVIQIFHDQDVKNVPNLEEEVVSAAGTDGHLNLTDFKKLVYPTDLCKVESVDRVFQKVKEDDSLKVEKKERGQKAELAAHAAKMDRVELAFRKFDLNKDGFLTRDEFDEMMKGVDKAQADRIFRSCDTAGDGRVSLDEFKAIIERGKGMAKQNQP